jgi:4-amino-4-deoxy-L-arabinose transferase-like glycosyltransferase
MSTSRLFNSQFVALAFVLLVGIFLRLPPSLFREHAPLHFLEILHPQPGFTGIGFDENLYKKYVNALSQVGITSYPELAEGYVSLQTRLPTAILPPTRFVYIFCAYLWQQITGAEALAALKNVSSLFGIISLVLAAVFATRLGGLRLGFGTSALMAFAPTQIHMTQHALIDGVFACFALACLWLLWENLQRPNNWCWLVGYGIALALLVLTKENALFAYFGLLAALAVSYWFRIGKVTRFLLATTILGPLVGVAILVNLCGSLATVIHIYQLLVSKAAVLPYAIKTGDGPWYRYVVDLSLVSPIVLLLAFGAIFTLQRTRPDEIYLTSFLAATFLIMCNVRYGMNLRYANMWDLPLRFLAASYLLKAFARFRHADFWFAFSITLLCAFDLRQYHILFVKFGLYELVPEGLLRALQILK